MLGLIFLVAAFICALIAAFINPSTQPPPRPVWGWLSLALYFASVLAGEISKIGH